MTGIIDVGGGARGIYGAGVLDRCMDEGIRFDVCVGVSAGSANLAAFLAGQRGRNYRFYAEYAARPEYMGPRTLLRTGEYIDLSYVYGTLSNEGGEAPLDRGALMRAPAALFLTATDAATGAAVYFPKETLRPNDYRALSASCAMPVACRPQELDGRRYYDGGLADPVPVEKALSLGCDRIALILTRPLSFTGGSRADLLAARLMEKTAPAIAALLRDRGRRYRAGVALALRLREEGRCLILAPDDVCGAGTVTKDPEKLRRLYLKGYRDARVLAFGAVRSEF